MLHTKIHIISTSYPGLIQPYSVESLTKSKHTPVFHSLIELSKMASWEELHCVNDESPVHSITPILLMRTCNTTLLTERSLWEDSCSLPKQDTKKTVWGAPWSCSTQHYPLSIIQYSGLLMLHTLIWWNAAYYATISISSFIIWLYSGRIHSLDISLLCSYSKCITLIWNTAYCVTNIHHLVYHLSL